MRVSHILVLVTLIAVGCRTHDDDPRLIKKASAETPSDAKAVSGSYYRGDGTGYNIYLTLKPNGSYAAEWQGCLGKYGEASGKWNLNEKRITFHPSKEEGNLKGHLKSLDVQKFNGDWVLLPTDFNEKRGVSRASCYQKLDKIK